MMICKRIAILLVCIYLPLSSINDVSAEKSQSKTAATATTKATITKKAVVAHYIELGKSMYKQAMSTAQDLATSIDTFLAKPTQASHDEVKKRYALARAAYQQTEVFRFSNPEVDELEGRVNAWPVDEGLIDYVKLPDYSRDHTFAQANVIAQKTMQAAGKTWDFSQINTSLLRSLHEIGGEEANVATGYHAIEFLIWGQDLHGFQPGAGKRPYTDYLEDSNTCTGKNCLRRRAYLKSVTELLVSDLKVMQELFANTKDSVLIKRLQNQDDTTNIEGMIQGIASLSYGELAGERMQLGLLLNDPEEEHDCFSDLTHLAHYNNVIGIRTIYTGIFTSLDGKTKLSGASLKDLISTRNPTLAKKLETLMASSYNDMKALYNKAEAGTPYDSMLDPNNTKGQQYIKNSIASLKALTKGWNELSKALGIKALEVEGSDSLDDPKKVLKPEKS